MRVRSLALLLAPLLLLPSPARPDDPKPAPPADPKPAAPKRAPDPPLRRAPVPRTLEEALRVLDARFVEDIEFKDTKVRDVVDRLSLLSGLNVILGPALVKDGEPDLKVTFRLRRVSVRGVLELVADTLRLGVGFRNGVVMLTTREEARGKPVLRLYSIADLAMPIRDFPAPDLLLHPAGTELPKQEETERKGAFSDPDEIAELLKSTTGEGTWADEGVSIRVYGHVLAVKQYAEVQREIAALLGLLRAFR